MAWYETFFDAGYTHAWDGAGAFAETAAEVEGIQSHLPATTGLRILDLPCGFGRHAGLLHAAGHRVTGMDLSPDQLHLAAKNNPGPTYVRGDMRDPPRGPFDVVLNLYSSIGYFPEATQDAQAIAAWHDALVPGGLLLLTGNHRDRIARFNPAAEPFDHGGGLWETPHIDWATGVNHSTVTMPDGAVRRFDVRLYSATDLIRMAREAGFADVEVYGDWDHRPVSPETRLVLVARTSI